MCDWLVHPGFASMTRNLAKNDTVRFLPASNSSIVAQSVTVTVRHQLLALCYTSHAFDDEMPKTHNC